MATEITLFDIPSKDPCKSWSLNVWRVRLILTYKSIPFTTHWLEYPEIQPHHESHSIPPNTPNSASPFFIPYTVPTILLPDSKDHNNSGTYIMDSTVIAREIEKRYPSSPPLHMDTPQQQKILDLWPKVMQIFGPPMLAPASRLLTEGSLPFFIETREAQLGCTLEEAAKGLDKAWEDATPILREIGDVLRENESGPFALGGEISYADFILVGAMQFLRRIGGEGKESFYEKFVAIEPAFGKLFEASKYLLVKDN